MEKTKTGQRWVAHEDVLAEKMPTWEKRRILAYGPKMMMVENEFAPGDTAPEHKHPHTQITYLNFPHENGNCTLKIQYFSRGK